MAPVQSHPNLLATESAYVQGSQIVSAHLAEAISIMAKKLLPNTSPPNPPNPPNTPIPEFQHLHPNEDELTHLLERLVVATAYPAIGPTGSPESTESQRGGGALETEFKETPESTAPCVESSIPWKPVFNIVHVTIMTHDQSRRDGGAPAEGMTARPLENRKQETGPSEATQLANPTEKARASVPEFKKVSETWNEQSYKYEIVESRTVKDQESHDEYIFLVRERVDRRSQEVTSYIDVKSEWLRDILRELLHHVKAVSLMEDRPSIEQNILFHFLPELDKCADSLEGDPDSESTCLKHLRLLIDHLKHAYASTSERLGSMLQHGHITYELLWALFKPGFHVYTTCFGSGEPRCVVFDAGEETTQDSVEFYKLECRFLDYDGVKFGETGIYLRILKFRGSKPIETLEAFPLHHHPSRQQVRKNLVERGRKFRDLAGLHIQHCTGNAFFMENGKPIRINLNSQVGVDAAFFREMLPNYSRPRLHDIRAKENEGISIIEIDTLISDKREQEKEKMQKDSVEAQQMSESDFLVCCPTICCFSFKKKMFLECAVGALQDVQWSLTSYNDLKVASKTKTLISSLTKTRLGLVQTIPFDNGIDGKGLGLNILLHGPPGVGKTFTVEATSERFKLPLYSISAGELVVDHGDSHALEQQLENIFKISKHFNAVLLLDEADAFMEQRTSYHDTHNRLVTVFLRKLEYYQGILFLTTNRMIQFDEAIMSRIHLTIKYEDLTREFRREIWEHSLSKAHTVQGPAVVKLDELQQLDNIRLNGREIKHLTSIAHALATVDGEPVSYKHLEKAAESSEKLLEKFGQESRIDGMYV